MAIIGAILGDISGSQYEFTRTNEPETCPMFTERCSFTEVLARKPTVLTVG